MLKSSGLTSADISILDRWESADDSKDEFHFVERVKYKLSGVWGSEVTGNGILIAATRVFEHEPRDWSCLVCKEPDAYESFVVHDALWKSAGFKPHDGVCHLACFEVKIGRRIMADDLQDLPMNRMLLHVLR